MNRIITILFVLITTYSSFAQKKESNEYVEFDDRKNVVHGVYLGFNVHYAQLDTRGEKETAFVNLKLAYVANQKMEVGIGITGFFNERPNDRPDLFNGDKVALLGGYVGLHLEPILFGKRFISVSFPVLVGGGAVGYFGNSFTDEYEDIKEEDFDEFFIVEPGINILYNFSRFTQLETGIRYRFTSDYNLPPYDSGNLNGFSVGVGLKLGIFNMGRKKKVKDNF
ncbi:MULTISPECIES: hypothetical protein [Hyunsoonleella]|uniref:Outer membrane protein beta-barrel domain-containing protein n=1 Tax=Hyunsoonleella pacifica TaxID=1080224 RepID=A0A4Q9FSL5_9FLAO|nr:MULTISPECIES: hypothetical protein [Hyunsoonleella]TBN16717.1 hypothetical protein EYD46_08790 [Hyunsoonleella pacifica]GGD17049.1 hypothetical protein GCM10011368_18770 [Hyunsoonleella pacifica]